MLPCEQIDTHDNQGCQVCPFWGKKNVAWTQNFWEFLSSWPLFKSVEVYIVKPNIFPFLKQSLEFFTYNITWQPWWQWQWINKMLHNLATTFIAPCQKTQNLVLAVNYSQGGGRRGGGRGGTQSTGSGTWLRPEVDRIKCFHFDGDNFAK